MTPLRSLPIARRMLVRDRARTLVTVLGVGVAVALPLLLFSVYAGARVEGNAWVAARPADAWVLHANSRNLVRSVSYMPESLGDGLVTIPGVRRVAPLLRVIASTEIGGRQVTFFVLGIVPGDSLTAPTVVEGRPAPRPGELLLDRALARKHGLAVGDSLHIQRMRFRVAGLTSGTNAVVTQFGFATLADAQSLLGYEGIVSYFLVAAAPGVAPRVVADTLRHRFDELNTFTAREFSENNLEEMEAGVTPLLGAVTAFGAAAGAMILALLLYGAVLERRADYALLKAVGASHGQVARLILRQALVLVVAGILAGTLIWGLAVPVLGHFIPELTVDFRGGTLMVTAAAALLLGAFASWLPIHRLRRIHPGEVFRP